ncbi:MAG: hypothetical protein ACRCZH_04365 [Cetobacterium sp.]
MLIGVDDSELNLSFEEKHSFNISEREVDYEYEVLYSPPLSEEYLKKIPRQRDLKSTTWERDPKLE